MSPETITYAKQIIIANSLGTKLLVSIVVFVAVLPLYFSWHAEVLLCIFWFVLLEDPDFLSLAAFGILVYSLDFNVRIIYYTSSSIISFSRIKDLGFVIYAKNQTREWLIRGNA